MIKSQVLTIDGKKDIVAFTPNEIKFKSFEFIKKRKGKRVYYYCPKFITFDTETSHTDTESWIYQWACKFDLKYIYGRTPSDFIEMLNRLVEVYNLSDTRKIILYIHNLSYEMQFLKHYIYQYDNNMEVLAVDAHNYICVDVKGFKFLCSYKLSGLNLDKFSKNYAQEYRKASGEIDYSILRYPDDELTGSDWFYQFSDVASQYDAIEQLLNIHGFKYAHEAPMTATGFVRTDCRTHAKKELFWRKKFITSKLTLEQYDLCRQGFMGGLTIASWKYAGTTVRGNIGHRDFTSSYPARQMLNYFPKGKPTWYGDVESIEEFEELINNYCCVFMLIADEVHIKEGVTAPYIPSSKCIKGLSSGLLKVNGKVVYADRLAIVITEIDYKCIRKQYDFSGGLSITKMLIFERGEMPEFLKDRVMYYFEGKCKLKRSNPLLYMASKALLNAIYGMTATAIIREEYKYNVDLILKTSNERNVVIDRESKLEEYYSSRNSFLLYQYSLYTTAWARSALIDMIECVGYDKFLYCDTDSIFYLKDDETEKALEAYNENIVKLAKSKGAYIDDKILGYADKEPDLKAFRALHAKCYAMIGLDNKLSCTIAGIPKESTKWIKGNGFTMLQTITNAQELGNIDNLNDGFVFKHCGGSRAIYIEQSPTVKEINGHNIELASGVIIEDITKEISDTMFTVGKNYELLNIKRQDFL